MDLGILGRGAAIGGASSGLGRAVAEALASEGCRLFLWSRSADRLERTAEEIRRAYDADVQTAAADAVDPAAALMIRDRAESALGKVDILVLNAGGPNPADPAQTDPQAWGQAFQLLAVTPIELATSLLPRMREAGWGRIVAILSSGVRQPIEDLPYSNAGRAALMLWLKTLAAKVAPDGVTVNGVVPGRIDTERVRTLDASRAALEGLTPDDARRGSEAAIPAGRYGRPAELGDLVAFLCSERASYVTGAFIAADGGLIRGL